MIDQETRDLRIGSVKELRPLILSSSKNEPVKAPKRYSRVLNRIDQFCFYEIATKFSKSTIIQIALLNSDVETVKTPISIAVGGVFNGLLYNNISYEEHTVKSVISDLRREKIFIPLLEDPAKKSAWKNYVVRASDPNNWNPQIYNLNNSPEIQSTSLRISTSSDLGGSGYVVENDIAGQILMLPDKRKTVAVINLSPRCTEGIMSMTWNFNIMETIFILNCIKKIIRENAPNEIGIDFIGYRRKHEPLIDMLSLR